MGNMTLVLDTSQKLSASNPGSDLQFRMFDSREVQWSLKNSRNFPMVGCIFSCELLKITRSLGENADHPNKREFKTYF